MIPIYLSQEWLALACEALSHDEELDRAVRATASEDTVTIVYVVRETPEAIADANGQVTYSIRLSSQDGVAFSGSVSSGPPESTVTLTLDYDTAVAIHLGELDPAIAMALARVRVSGAAGRLVPLQDALARVPNAFSQLGTQTSY